MLLDMEKLRLSMSSDISPLIRGLLAALPCHIL